MTAIIDYGVGNLFSLESSLNAIGEKVIVTKDIDVIRSADRVILPGVGAFPDAIKKLRDSGLFDEVIALAEEGKPLMGICLGMQMLFNKSYEYGEYDGLGLVDGDIIPFEGKIPPEYKIPHIGWNKLKIVKKDCPIFKYINEGDHVYFVHSFYAANCDDSLAATSDYPMDFTAAVNYKNVYGCQFHPEKSGEVGLNILRGFCEIGEK